MGLFQKAPRTPEEAALAAPLEIGPDRVQEMNEEQWYAQVYRGDSVPQLTWRGVIMGSVLGFILAFTNLYVGLTAGWSLGVVITAALLAYAIWNLFLAIGVARTPMGILEMNCMASTASAAGYATGGTVVSAIAAMMMMSATPENPQGQHIPLHVLMLWTGSVGFLGTIMAIPMKRNMVNHERLKFPTGTAAAVTLQSLYTHGHLAMRKAKALLWSGAVSGVLPLLFELNLKLNPLTQQRGPLLPADSGVFNWLPSPANHPKTGAPTTPYDWTWRLDHAPFMVAAGMLVGLRTTLSMLAGGILLYYFVVPAAVHSEFTLMDGSVITAVTAPNRVFREAGLWLGVSILVASSLLTFSLQWRSIARAFTGVFGDKSSGNASMEAKIAATEVPFSWFLAGFVFFGGTTALLADLYFQVPLLLGILAVILTFVLCLVACRVTGETDITPMGPLGKITQLTYGVLIPGNVQANLMAASITGNSAGNSADLLTDLKSGYLLGANPRRQFLAQFLGVITGTIATSIGFRLLVQDATALNGYTDAAGTVHDATFDAPSAAQWKGVADLLAMGFKNMHPMHQSLIIWGAGLGIALVLIEFFMPRAKRFLPSATGVGFGMIFGFNYAISMLIGAVAAWIWQRKSAKTEEEFLVPVAGGIIAGYTLVAVVVTLLNLTVLK